MGSILSDISKNEYETHYVQFTGNLRPGVTALCSTIMTHDHWIGSRRIAPNIVFLLTSVTWPSFWGVFNQGSKHLVSSIFQFSAKQSFVQVILFIKISKNHTLATAKWIKLLKPYFTQKSHDFISLRPNTRSKAERAAIIPDCSARRNALEISHGCKSERSKIYIT